MEDDQEYKPKKLYRCEMRTCSGMYAQYDGHIDVWSDGEDLFMDAVRTLRRGVFPDYSADMWRLVSSRQL